MRKLLMALMLAVLFVALLTVSIFATFFNAEVVDVLVSLQAEDTADFGAQLVMEKSTSEEPRFNISTVDFETPDAVADVFTMNYGQILNKGLPSVDTGQLFVMIDSASITSQQEVSAHLGSISPIYG